MVIIEFYNDGRMLKGILLGKYYRPHDEVFACEKRILGETRTIYKRKTLHTSLYVVFIPWKHRLKELREVDEKYIVNPQAIPEDESWIKIDQFTSEMYDGYILPLKLEVKDFVGYKFIYSRNSFVANLSFHEFGNCLAMLYESMPEVLTVNLDNVEE